MTTTTTIVTLEATRTDYSAEEASKRSLTVGKLIKILEQYDEDTPVVFSNDGGYTYGRMSWGTVSEVEFE